MRVLISSLKQLSPGMPWLARRRDGALPYLPAKKQRRVCGPKRGVACRILGADRQSYAVVAAVSVASTADLKSGWTPI
ncbi:hypothetical protein GCM10010301_32500 [Streptomyces plicatus]|nr:hypothetical protein GCM10010301_32500 [Streptomyces plicatus]